MARARWVSRATAQRIGVTVPQTDPRTDYSYCLFVIVTDPQGAQRLATHPVQVVERKLVLRRPPS